MQGNRRRRAREQEIEQALEVWEVSGDQDVTGLASQPIADPGRRIVRLEIGRRFEFGERVASAPECLSGLAGAKLAAVPHDVWSRAAGRRFVCRVHGLRFSTRGQRPARVDLGADRFGMMNQEKLQWLAYAISPARMRSFNRFSWGGSGQVVYGLKAQGGL